MKYTAAGKRRKSGKVHEFDIDIEYACDLLYKEQGGRCALSGVPLMMAARNYPRKGHARTASLDRIDSTKGYIPGNVQWVHKAVNTMKNTMADIDFIAWCHRVARTHKDPIPEIGPGPYYTDDGQQVIGMCIEGPGPGTQATGPQLKLVRLTLGESHGS